MLKDELKDGNGNGVKRSIEMFRLITPMLITVCIFIVSGISVQLAKLDNKVFVHLTNHEIHIPRQQMVSSAEFKMRCEFDDKARTEIRKSMDSLHEDIRAVLIELKESNK